MTRLGASSATISADPVPPEGTKIQMLFRQPTDNQEVTVSAKVGAMLTEGGLWRGRAAMLVRFDSPVNSELIPTDKGAEIRKKIQSDRRGADPSRLAPGAGASLGGALTASGRGRRRRPASQLASESLLETMDAPPVAVTLTGSSIEPLRVAPAADSRSLREQLGGGDEQQDTGDPLGSGSSSGDDGDHDFFGKFQGGGTFDELPPVHNEDELSRPPARGTVEDLLATSTQPNVAELPPVQDITARVPATSEDSAPATQGTGGTSSGPDADRPPWEDASEDAARSFIPRHIRIASSLEITFWSRGRKHEATAQNFSREGAFLAYNGDPPIRGAIVRVEFPIDWSGESLPVRFNAEVRWHRADQPGANVPEGFGVQILTFESPKDQGRYDEMLVMLLELNKPDQGNEGKVSYRWGAPNRS
jgi:hypothetical protein